MTLLDDALVLVDEIEALGCAIAASLDDPARLMAHIGRRAACVQQLVALVPAQGALPPTAFLRLACAVTRLDTQGRNLQEAVAAHREAIANRLTRLRQKRSIQGAYANRGHAPPRGALEVRG